MTLSLPKRKNADGFTLIELLIVIAIISILAIVILVGLKPAKRLADTRDARRAQDLNQILTGILSCAIDKKDNANMNTCLGTYNVGDTYEIVTTGTTTNCNSVCTSVTSATHCLPLDIKLTDYFTELPKDPGTVTSGHTNYSITIQSNNMVVLQACSAENGTIKISR